MEVFDTKNLVKRRKVTAIYEERLMCDQCGTEMRATGIERLTMPTQVEYICPKCHKQMWVHGDLHFPRLAYEYEEENT